MAHVIESIRAEYRRYKALADSAMAQLDEAALLAHGPGDNSIVVICWHVAGNLQSRFTDFLTADGEKPWRQRDEEFADRIVARVDLLEKWEQGWRVLFDALEGLTDGDLDRVVTIRGHALTVCDALHRSLAHAAYHTGQIVYIAKSVRGSAWTSLSIPPGQSDAYRARPDPHAVPR